MNTDRNLSSHGQESDYSGSRAAQRTRVALLRAALELILEHGYDRVSVADITRLADYGRSTFYLHFRDKEDLVWALLYNQIAQLDAQIVAAVEPLKSPQREYMAWRMIFETIEQQRSFFLQMDGELSRRLRQMQKVQLISNFERQLRDGYYSLLTDVPPELGARFIVGALLELLDYWLQHPEAGTPEVMARHMFRLVFRRDPD
ncbi:MAG: hypothetical protein CL610_14445 [Anaerolineaceae bacterium]|nr:hypothetical protein [Anaerolineaceae bacterium]